MKYAKRMNTLAGLTLAAAAMFATALVGVSIEPRVAHAAPSQQQYQQKLQDQAQLKQQLAGVSKNLSDTILSLSNLTDTQIPAAQKAVQSAQQQAQQAQGVANATAQRLQAAQADKANLEKKIAQTGVNYDDAKAAVAQMARDSFHGSNASTVMSVVTNSTTTQDFVNKMQADAAVTRSEANAANDAANVMNTSMNRRQRVVAIENQITQLKTQADSQAVTAQQAAEIAQSKQSQLLALQQQGNAERASLQQQKSGLTTKAAQQAADIVTIKSQLDAYNQQYANNQASSDPSAGGAQQISGGGAVPSAPSNGGNSGGSGGGGGGGASGMNYAVPGNCPAGSTYCYGHPTGNVPGVGGSAYPARQCTLWAYLRRSDLGLPVGSYMGNGADWANTARSYGYLVNNTPHVGAAMVFAQGQQVTSWYADSTYGHVAVVEYVYGDNSVLISEGGTGFSSFPTSERVYNASSYQYVQY